jgi:hypothetical protein
MFETLPSEGSHNIIHCMHATQIIVWKDWEQNERDDKQKERDIVIRRTGEIRYERYDNWGNKI